jgi:hypothetical protein
MVMVQVFNLIRETVTVFRKAGMIVAMEYYF